MIRPLGADFCPIVNMLEKNQEARIKIEADVNPVGGEIVRRRVGDSMTCSGGRIAVFKVPS
jgi:hypothetical protein